MRSRLGYRTSVPNISSSKGQTKPVSYKDGIARYKDNDDVKRTEVVLAVDARFRKIGRYKTRKGCDRYSVPIGEAVNADITSTTGADDAEITAVKAVAQLLTAGADGRATMVEVNLKGSADASGTVLVELYDDDSGAPGNLLASSSIASSDISSTYAYLPAYFMAAPEITDTSDYWLVLRGQESVTGTYYVSTTTDATTALTSTDGGASWSSQSFAANVKLYTADDGGVKGLWRAYRSNGNKATFFAHGDTVYTVDDTTGTTTTVKSGLTSAAARYRFQVVQDALYWVNGQDKPYKYDFSTVTEITASPYIPSLILEHQSLLFFVDSEDKTRLYWTNYAQFDVFTSTDFMPVPAPKSYDSLTALAKLNGALFMFANRNKFTLLGTDNATFALYESNGQKGTFSQESVVWDHDNIYFAADDGIYQFNGTSEVNIALPILDDYLAIPNKENITLELYNNRLYIFHTPVGAGDNQECLVWNVLLNRWESFDKRTMIGRTFGRWSQDNLFLQASNRVGAVYYGELDTNDYCNLGDVLQYEIATAYDGFGMTGQKKWIPMWRPVFSAQATSYNIQAGYAWDFSDEVTWQDVPVGGTGLRYDSGLTYDSGLRYGSLTSIHPTSLQLPGEGFRVQRRYRHIAAREPVEVTSEVLTVQVQRVR